MRPLNDLLRPGLEWLARARRGGTMSSYTGNVKRIRFDRFVVDRGRRELMRDGEIVHLSPKAYLLLDMLIEAAPDAVSRDVLYKGIWPETFVDEVNLSNLVKELRKALEDDSRSPRFIKTLHGFGYAFNEVPRAESEGQQEVWAPFVLEWSSREFPLRVGRNVIGRDTGADIRVDSAGVSRQHAAIVADVSGATIEDLGSKNGTVVDETPADGATPLREMSTIRLGTATLRIRRITASDTTMTVTADE